MARRAAQFDAIAAAQAAGTADLSFLYVGIALLIAGFGFSLVPFPCGRRRLPGAPAPVTAFMSIGTRAGDLPPSSLLRDRRP